MNRPLDLQGQTFGRLTVLERTSTQGYWMCQCACGTKKVIRGSSMTSGNTKSCGCLTRENPGRPKRPKTAGIISPYNFTDAATKIAFDMLKMKLMLHNVLITDDHDLFIAGEHIGTFPTHWHALGKALQTALATPDKS